jgi:hypothetical protein
MVQLSLLSLSVPGVKSVSRNKLHISEEARPAVSLFDGDEESNWEDDSGRSRHAKSPTLVTMSPEITLLLADKPEEVGSKLNEFRAAFLKVVLNDVDLQTIVGENGEIRYRGCSTSVLQGRSMEAEMGLDISFRYPLFPTKL